MSARPALPTGWPRSELSIALRTGAEAAAFLTRGDFFPGGFCDDQAFERVAVITGSVHKRSVSTDGSEGKSSAIELIVLDCVFSFRRGFIGIRAHFGSSAVDSLHHGRGETVGGGVGIVTGKHDLPVPRLETILCLERWA